MTPQVAPLRDYQELAVALVGEAVRAGRRRLYVELPTGTGKSRVLAEVARATLADGGGVLVVAHRRELVRQLAATMGAVTGQAAGIVMAGTHEPAARLVAGSVQTLRGRRLDDVLRAEPVRLLILDEAHHVTARNAYGRLVRRVEQAHPAAVTLGATATPYRADSARMQDVLTDCVFTRSVPAMQDAGWLAPLDWRRVELSELDLTRVKTGRVGGDTDYSPSVLAALVNTSRSVAAVVAATVREVGSRRCVVFAVDVAHAQALAAAYRRAGLSAEAVWGQMPPVERTAALADWRAGRVQLVVNVAVLTEGYDLPELAAVVMARPTMSPGLYVQCIGRGLRPHPSKADCLVLDVAGNACRVATRQVTLPAILGELPGSGSIGGSDAATGTGVTRNSPPRGKASPARLLLDPVGNARWSWACDDEPGTDGVYATSLWDRSYAALVPDPAPSGLYWPLYVEHGRAEQWTDCPLPLRDAVGAVERAVLEGTGRLPRAASRTASWLAQPATGPALALLCKLDPAAADLAQRESWTRGDVSGRINVAKVRGPVSRWVSSRTARSTG